MFIKSVLVLLLFSCNVEVEETIKEIDKEEKAPKIPYKICLKNIAKERERFYAIYLQGNESGRQAVLDSASHYLERVLTQEVLPYWYGTPWDFNGYTNVPNEGNVACGYLVSTTLKHVGFKLNRYKLAQQSATSEARTLQSKPIKTYRHKSNAEMVELAKSELTPGLYLIGLDNHVGYLHIKNKDVFFIHSSYCSNQVEKERALDAPCFSSDIYVLAAITTNRELIKKWILGDHIPIKMD